VPEHPFKASNLLNPGVILNADPLIHVENIKPMPAADELVDRCIECGFCEPIRVQEPVGYAREYLLPRLRQVRKLDRIALHITCRARKMGLDSDFLALAETCAEQVFQPQEQGCCGFAGEKGFTTPELNACALSRLKQQLPKGCRSGYSNSRTCEIGLSRHAGIPYRSVLYLVDECFD
jgi:D-lactate dehydrogenase